MGLPIDVPEVEEATPLGAAILAGIGIGLYRNEHEAFEHVYRPGKTYLPDPHLAPDTPGGIKFTSSSIRSLKAVNHQLYDQFMVERTN